MTTLEVALMVQHFVEDFVGIIQFLPRAPPHPQYKILDVFI
jgi:hypothetical protein